MVSSYNSFPVDNHIDKLSRRDRENQKQHTINPFCFFFFFWPWCDLPLDGKQASLISFYLWTFPHFSFLYPYLFVVFVWNGNLQWKREAAQQHKDNTLTKSKQKWGHSTLKKKSTWQLRTNAGKCHQLITKRVRHFNRSAGCSVLPVLPIASIVCILIDVNEGSL